MFNLLTDKKKYKMILEGKKEKLSINLTYYLTTGGNMVKLINIHYYTKRFLRQ